MAAISRLDTPRAPSLWSFLLQSAPAMECHLECPLVTQLSTSQRLLGAHHSQEKMPAWTPHNPAALVHPLCSLCDALVCLFGYSVAVCCPASPIEMKFWGAGRRDQFSFVHPLSTCHLAGTLGICGVSGDRRSILWLLSTHTGHTQLLAVS